MPLTRDPHRHAGLANTLCVGLAATRRTTRFLKNNSHRCSGLGSLHPRHAHRKPKHTGLLINLYRPSIEHNMVEGLFPSSNTGPARC